MHADATRDLLTAQPRTGQVPACECTRKADNVRAIAAVDHAAPPPSRRTTKPPSHRAMLLAARRRLDFVPRTRACAARPRCRLCRPAHHRQRRQSPHDERPRKGRHRPRRVGCRTRRAARSRARRAHPPPPRRVRLRPSRLGRSRQRPSRRRAQRTKRSKSEAVLGYMNARHRDTAMRPRCEHLRAAAGSIARPPLRVQVEPRGASESRGAHAESRPRCHLAARHAACACQRLATEGAEASRRLLPRRQWRARRSVTKGGHILHARTAAEPRL
eukprot:6180437-Pleurochrysis_carterae.AAC.3